MKLKTGTRYISDNTGQVVIVDKAINSGNEVFVQLRDDEDKEFVLRAMELSEQYSVVTIH